MLMCSDEAEIQVFVLHFIQVSINKW